MPQPFGDTSWLENPRMLLNPLYLISAVAVVVLAVRFTRAFVLAVYWWFKIHMGSMTRQRN